MSSALRLDLRRDFVRNDCIDCLQCCFVKTRRGQIDARRRFQIVRLDTVAKNADFRFTLHFAVDEAFELDLIKQRNRLVRRRQTFVIAEQIDIVVLVCEIAAVKENPTV